jgi:hypothetical protein
MAPTTTVRTTSTVTTTTTTPSTATPAADGAGDSLLWTAPIIVSVLALLVAVWSAYSSHRSRRAGERTAGLTDQRRWEEQAPSIEFVGADAAPDEAIRIVNMAAVAYTSVRFAIVPSLDEPHPVDALQVGDEDPDIGGYPRWIGQGQAWDLGPLGPGDHRLLDARRPGSSVGWPTTAGTLRLLLDCLTETYTVSVIRTCDIPPKPPEPSVSWG